MKRMKHSKKSLAIVLMLTFMGIGTVAGGPKPVYADAVGTVGVSALNLRSGASTGTGIIGVLYEGAEVTITGTSGDWYKVTANVGGSKKTGYVFSSYVETNSQSQSGSSSSGNGTVNVNGLRLRAKASTSSSILGSVNSGTRVTILETLDEWYKVGVTINGSYKTGYMYKSYVTLSSGSSSSGSSDTTTSASGKGVVNTPVLNVRKGASTSTTRIGCIYQGQTVTITGISGDWYQVSTVVNGKTTTGYVSAQYITKQSGSSSSDASQDTGSSESSLSGSGKVNVSALNVRKSATTSSSVLTCISKNTVVTLKAKSGDWYKISVESNGRTVTGYVFAEYITKVSDSDSSDNSQSSSGADQSVENKIGKVNTAALNLRSKPSTSSSIIGTLYLNGSVTITAVSADNDWYKVQAPVNGKTVTGYVFAEYIDLTGDTSSSGEGDSSSDISFTDDEVELLAALVYCEAGNQSYEGKLAVANVVLNRLNSSQFPNTIKDVIYQKNQFSPASSGALEKALNNGVPSDCVKAAKDAMSGNNNVEGFLFFNTVVNTDSVADYIQIGDHIFYHY